MATCKQSLQVGDTVFILGKYAFDPKPPTVIEVTIAYEHHKRFYAYPKANHGTFSFLRGDWGEVVFSTREEAEAALDKMKGGASND